MAEGNGRQIDRLHRLIANLGGAATIRGCGAPVTQLGFQSTLAWELGVNVADVGFKPGRAIARRRPIVVFTLHRFDWQVRPFHLRGGSPVRCAGLRTRSAIT